MSESSDEFEAVIEPSRPKPAAAEALPVARVLKPVKPRKRGIRKRVSDLVDAATLALAVGVSKIRPDNSKGGDWLSLAPMHGEKELKIDYDARLEKQGLPVEMSTGGIEYVVLEQKGKRVAVPLLPQSGLEVSFKGEKEGRMIVMTEDGPRELAPWLTHLMNRKAVFEKCWKDPDTGKTRKYTDLPPDARADSYHVTFTRNGRKYVIPLLMRPYQDDEPEIPNDTRRRVYLGMGDKVTCTAVFTPPAAEGQLGVLFLDTADSDFRQIPVRPKGTPRVGQPGRNEVAPEMFIPTEPPPEWEFLVVSDDKGGELLEIEPSLLCADSGFHTDYTWRCRFVRLAAGEHALDRFLAENPGKAWAKSQSAEITE